MSIQWTVLGFEPTTFKHESPPITTRPGLPPTIIVSILDTQVQAVLAHVDFWHHEMTKFWLWAATVNKIPIKICWFFLKNGPVPASFCLFSFFSCYNFNNTNWKKHWWCAWDSNPGPQDGRCRQSQGAMAATLYLTLFLLYLFPSFSSSICICLLSLSPDPIFCFFLCHSSLYLSLSLLELML